MCFTENWFKRQCCLLKIWTWSRRPSLLSWHHCGRGCVIITWSLTQGHLYFKSVPEEKHLSNQQQKSCKPITLPENLLFVSTRTRRVQENLWKLFPKCSLWEFHACIQCILFTPTPHCLPTSHGTSQHIYLPTSSLLLFNSIYWVQLVLPVRSQGPGHPLEHGLKEKWPPHTHSVITGQ